MTQRARARHSDPPTSHAAARSVGEFTANQRAVMTVMRVVGQPMLDETLVREYQARFKALRLPQQSESGIRSRRSELAKAEHIIQESKERMSTGRLGRTWAVARKET